MSDRPFMSMMKRRHVASGMLGATVVTGCASSADDTTGGGGIAAAGDERA